MFKKNNYLKLAYVMMIASYSTGHSSFNDPYHDEGLRHRKPLLKKVNKENFEDLNTSTSKITSTETDLSSISQKYFFFA